MVVAIAVASGAGETPSAVAEEPIPSGYSSYRYDNPSLTAPVARRRESMRPAADTGVENYGNPIQEPPSSSDTGNIAQVAYQQPVRGAELSGEIQVSADDSEHGMLTQAAAGGEPSAPTDLRMAFKQSPQADIPTDIPGTASQPDPRYLMTPPPEPADQPWSGNRAAPWLTLQRTRGWLAFLPADSANIGVTEIDGRAVMGVRNMPGFSVSPEFGITAFNGPSRTDLPGETYQLGVELRQLVPLSQRWGMELALTPSLYTDFDAGGSDAFRLIGRAVAAYNHSPQTRLLLGLTYLDREDVPVLPIFGIVHHSGADLRYDLVFPKPKVAFRVHRTPTGEGWTYIGGEFGGDAWAIQRRSGADDIVYYKDWRLLIGYESRNPGALSWLAEGALVFNRSLEYESEVGDFDPDATVMIRFGFQR